MSERKVGVYICQCGGNISDYVDVEKVKAAVEDELGVTVSRTTMFSCSDASQTEMIKDIKEQGLDGMVVASCSPKLHLTTFRSVAERAGLNKFQYVQVNIREQCSWAHSDDREGATEKAIGLVKGGLEKAKLTEPLEPIRVNSIKSVLVLGAGVAGLRAALEMADLGVEVFLLERDHFIGGEVARLGKMYPSGRNGGEIAAQLYEDIGERKNIHLFTGAEMTSKEGYIGNFSVRVRIRPRFVTGTDGDFEKAEKECPVEVPSEIHRGLRTRKAIYRPGRWSRPEKWAIDQEACTKCGRCAEICPGAIDLEQQEEFMMLDAGAIITATGFESYSPSEGESGYGTGGVVTLPQFESMVDNTGSRLEFGRREIRDVVFIYCVGSRQSRDIYNANRYCSRFCCNAAVGAALNASKKIKGLRTWHLYRDVRTYGKFELLYEQVSSGGAVFCRFDPKYPPIVEEEGDRLLVTVNDLLTGGDEIGIGADLVVLVTGMVPSRNDQLTSILRLPVGEDGFYNEIHTKLRPVETVIDGVYIGGCSQGPKNSTESIASSLSCVSKAAALLVKGYVDLQPFIAYVIDDLCKWCGECEKACPYSAIEETVIDGREIAVVRDVLCKGCGACLPVCPYDATQLKGFTDDQIKSMIEAFAAEAECV
jgi:heterodisulfide reductase subunit A